MRGFLGLGLALGVLMFLAGLLLTARGLGYLGGESPQSALAVLGPVLAGFGIALVITVTGALRR